MEVYKFDKSFLERMDELESVSVVPMNHQQLQEEWVNFIEVRISIHLFVFP